MSNCKNNVEESKSYHYRSQALENNTVQGRAELVGGDFQFKCFADLERRSSI
jgi:hypothetical protein